jgi:hypothetical protein
MTLDLTNDIFLAVEAAKDFIFGNQIIQNSKQCPKCLNRCILIRNNSYKQNTIYYRCEKRNCMKIVSLYPTKLPFVKLLHVIYLLLLDATYFQLRMYYGFSD